nr:YibE/F family protein [uncultured Agathobacter sp.]
MKIKKISVAIVSIALMIVFCIALNNVKKTELMSTDDRNFEKAIVTEIVKDNEASDGTRAGQQQVKVKIRTGRHKGEILDATSSSSYLYGAQCSVGTKVIVIISESDDFIQASVYNYDRGNKLYMIIAFFLLVLVIIGGIKGFKSGIGLVFTFCCIIFIFMPLIYRGVSPILAAAFVVVITTIVVMYLIDGFTVKAGTAMLGTIIGVIIAAIFAYIFGKICNISGYNVDDVESLEYIGRMTDIKIGELMFAGILISSLGAVMDVAMSVSSTINEIHNKNPYLDRKGLFKSGINVGRDMMGTMSNTLILAFAGGSINTFVYIYSYNYQYYQVLDMYSIGIEVIQGISATLGVILTVPIVSFIASIATVRKR